MAVVAAYNFNSLLASGEVPDQAGYSRDLTLDSGVVLGAGYEGRGLQCDVGGGSASYTSGNYIGNGASFSCFARVKSLSGTAGTRVIAENRRGSDRYQALLLSDASGNLAARITVGGTGSDVTYSSGVSVLDGAWHHVGVAYDALSTGDVTFWVDGSVVATVNRGAGAASEQDGVFAIGRSTTGSTVQRANAIIDDLRWFNDPVYTSEASLFTASVLNLTVGAYSFDEVGSTVKDYTLRQNDLTLTANGSRAAAVNGTGLFSTTGHGAQGDVTFWTGGTFDRLTVCGWAKVTTTGGAAAFISFEDASSNPKLQVFRGGANALLIKAWGDTLAAPFDGNYLFTDDSALSTSEWRFFFVNINPTGYELRVYSAAGAALVNTGGPTGNPPTNAPIVSGISKLRLGGGIVALDDVRVLRNYINGAAAVSLISQPVVQEPAPILVDNPVGSLTLSGSAVAAVAHTRTASGGVGLGGYGLVAVARTAVGALGLAGAAAVVPVHVLTAVGGPTVGGSTKTEQGSGALTASGALSLTGATSVVVFEGTVATSAYGALSLGGSAAVVAPVAVSAVGALSLGVAIEWERIGGQGYVLVVRGRPVRLGAVVDVPSPFKFMPAEVPQSLVKVGGLYSLVNETDEEMIAQAERVYLGGRRYVVDDVVRAELIEAGYGDWLTS